MKKIRLHLCRWIVLLLLIGGCSTQTATIKLVISNPELEVQTASLIGVKEKLNLGQRLTFFLNKWLTKSYSFSRLKPTETKVFYLANIKRDTYYLYMIAEVGGNDLAYGGEVFDVKVDKDTTEVKIELKRLRLYKGPLENQEIEK